MAKQAWALLAETWPVTRHAGPVATECWTASPVTLTSSEGRTRWAATKASILLEAGHVARAAVARTIATLALLNIAGREADIRVFIDARFKTHPSWTRIIDGIAFLTTEVLVKGHWHAE